MFNIITGLWNVIRRHIFVGIINFFSNITRWFQDSWRLHQLEIDKNKLAVSVKNNLSNGNYRVINCLYNQRTGTVEDIDNGALGIESNGVDSETQRNFGNKDMLIFN